MADSSLRDKNLEDTFEVKKWKTSILGESISLWSIKAKGKFYFFGKEVAEALGYKNPKDAVLSHVDSEDKKTIEEVLGTNYKCILKRIKSTGDILSPDDFIRKIRSHQKLITELGLISFCTESGMPRAKSFQRWVYKTIQEIRETGSYTLPGGPVDNPLDLIIDKVSTSFEKEIQSLREKIHTLESQKKLKTCKKRPQSSRKIIRNSLKKLENEIEIIKAELELSFEETSSSSYQYSSNSD